MTDSAPRCPLCANVLKLEPTFWERIGLRSNKVRCPSCHHDCDPREADMMGSTFWHWAENFRGDLLNALEKLPVLSEAALDRAMGSRSRHEGRLMPSTDELIRSCMKHQRPVLIEMARGRDASLEIAHLGDDAAKTIDAVAILGTSSSESGGKEWQQLIARSSATHFVLYNHPSAEGAEARVKQAIHAKGKNKHIGTTARASAMPQESLSAKRKQHA